MRIRFGLGEAQYDAFTVVIVLNILGRTVGMVVDGVSDVLELSEDSLKPPPEFGAAIDTAYIRGLATAAERMIIIMDIEKLLSSDDMALVDVARAGAR